MKLLLKLVVLLLIIVGGAIFAGLYAIDSIARSAIERGGTFALGVETSLEKASVSVLSGAFSLEGLTVANPEGFGEDPFLALGSGGVAVDFGTLREDLVELPVLELDDLDLALVRKGGNANYRVILDSLERLRSGQTPKDDVDDGKRFVIREVAIRNINVRVDLLGIGGPAARDLPIEEIRLRNVGAAGEGLPMSELSAVVVQAILQAIADNGGGVLPDDLLGDLSGALANSQSLRELGISSVAEIGSSIGEKIGELTGNEDLGGAIQKGLGDLTGLGGKKDDG